MAEEQEKIEFHRLTHEFYATHTHLVEVMDKDRQTGVYNEDKRRGYGVLTVNIKGLKFAIPLRSKMKMNHKFN